MTSPAAPSPPRPGHGASFIAAACGLAWVAVALSARGTSFAVSAMLAAITSLALCLWLCHERRRLTRALADAHAAHAQLAACSGLFEASMHSDAAQLLARSAGLLGATRAWLRTESFVGDEQHDWPSAVPAASAPWWQAPLAEQPLWIDASVAPARCAVQVRQGDLKLGVLAFEFERADQALAPALQASLQALAILLAQRLLRQRLERALSEASEQHTRERRVFLSNLSHKLRTPMTAVLGFAQILNLDDSLSAEHREYMREIEGAGQTLLNMLNELVGIPRE